MSAPKRLKTSHYRDRIPLDDDYEIIHSRSSHLTSRNIPVDSARSPMKGRTSWTVGNRWAPDDDEELALDETDAQYNAQISADVFDSVATSVDERPKRKRKRVRSRISVRAVARLLEYVHTHLCFFRLGRMSTGRTIFVANILTRIYDGRAAGTS